MIFADLCFWNFFWTKYWNFILRYSDKNGLHRYIVNEETYDQVMQFLLMYNFGEKNWNSKAYFSYRRYHGIFQIFKGESPFSFGKFWNTFTRSTVLKTQD